MPRLYGALSPEAWMAELFGSQSAIRGQVIRRSRRDVERYAGMDALKAEVARRGYRAVENSGQVVIFCNRAPITRLV
ncbi:N-(5'-phosphoribosyl)anthranilate isomerase [Roseivivax sp. GX 12232]|uniref:N-(5'-phosphoribosyl)anthranilate isomerase n=1 Tax=Roseivivax sp. GX 12232 TaxID=2900547 RepID=UPI001E6245F0|nr:N-(5'-phosphoribosyl)anthranilate isomerase [Roseivivax sp. GX 12232]MCE0503738.1 N-(5'-phosphoribosyl)anthranilate isomerase [Roseivivax sp. GX 12232]